MNNEAGLLIAGSSPHIKDRSTTRSLMLDVLIALIPASAMAVYFYGWYALVLLLVGSAGAVLSEWLWQHFMKKPQSISDLSAVVTGLLLALNMPPKAPWWLLFIGSVFAIIVVKMLFGGIGCNFLNPALAARALLMASWPVQMTSFVVQSSDAVSTATPLSIYKLGSDVALPKISELLLGHMGGCLGESSALALLIGAAYLLLRRVISWEIPLVYLATTALLMGAFAREGFFQGDVLFQLLGGGLLLGAFFMATDYTTSPMMKSGQIMFAFGCGFLTFIIRRFGGYPEGVSYSILIMNLLVPLIDRFTKPVQFGGEHHEKAA